MLNFVAAHPSDEHLLRGLMIAIWQRRRTSLSLLQASRPCPYSAELGQSLGLHEFTCVEYNCNLMNKNAHSPLDSLRIFPHVSNFKSILQQDAHRERRAVVACASYACNKIAIPHAGPDNPRRGEEICTCEAGKPDSHRVDSASPRTWRLSRHVHRYSCRCASSRISRLPHGPANSREGQLPPRGCGSPTYFTPAHMQAAEVSARSKLAAAKGASRLPERTARPR